MTEETVPWGNADTGNLPASGKIALPVLQWSHDCAAMIGEVAKWQALGLSLPYELTEVRFRGAGGRPHKEQCYLAESLSFAALAWRERWEKGTGDDRRRIPEYEEGAHSRLHILALLKDALDVGPAILTFKSTASRDMKKMLRHYEKEPLSAANAAAKRQMPLCSFWLTVAAGEPIATREGGTITPPVLTLPAAAAVKDWLHANYVGQRVFDIAREHVCLIDDWSASMATPAAANGDGESAMGATPEVTGPLCDLHDLPMHLLEKATQRQGRPVYGHRLSDAEWCDGEKVHIFAARA